jgi:hypothetical protein
MDQFINTKEMKMANYKIEFMGKEPVWGAIDMIPADDEGQARNFADDEIFATFPDYTDVEITKVTEIVI